MRKRNIKFITVILIIAIVLIYYNYTSLKFNLDITNVNSIEYRFDSNHGEIVGEITSKEDISSIIKYLNSLSLLNTISKPKDATEWLGFKDNNGNLIKGYAFGKSGVLWVGNETYMFGDSYINKIKKLIHINEKEN